MIINIHSFFAKIILLTTILYFCQDVFYTSGSPISVLSNFFILFISSIYCIKSLLIKKKDNILYYLVIFIVLISLGFAYSDVTSQVNISVYSTILFALLPFFPFYYFGYRNSITDNNLKIFFYIMLLVAIARYYNSISSITASNIIGNDNVVSNSAYLFVVLIPYTLLFHKDRLLANISLIIITMFIIQTSKRGALISALLSISVIFYYQIFASKKAVSLKNLLYGALIILTTVFFTFRFLSKNEFLWSRFESLEEGGTSGRDVIYSNLWNNWYHSESIVNQVFGFGFNSTLEHSGVNAFAHNDWLELLTNFGLIGSLLYAIIFASLFYFSLNSRVNSKLRYILLSIIVIFLLRSIFSMNYSSYSTILLSILIGYTFGFNRRIVSQKLSYS